MFSETLKNKKTKKNKTILQPSEVKEVLKIAITQPLLRFYPSKFSLVLEIFESPPQKFFLQKTVEVKLSYVAVRKEARRKQNKPVI